MELPDGTTLMHGTRPYDPAKARDYYLRTRKLKGRKKGRVDERTANWAKQLKGLTDSQIREQALKVKDPKDKKIIEGLLKKRQQLKSKNLVKDVGSNSIKSGDVQKRMGKEAADKARAKVKAKVDAAKEVESASKDLTALNLSLRTLVEKRRILNDKTDTSSEEASLRKKIDDTKKKLDAALEKQRSLTATK